MRERRMNGERKPLEKWKGTGDWTVCLEKKGKREVRK